MIRKLLALFVMAAASVVGFSATAAPAQADPFDDPFVCGQPMEPDCIPTAALIELSSDGPGEPIDIVVSASANTVTPPEGDLAVSVSAASSAARGARALVAAPLFTTTVHFVDEAIRIVGPGLPKGSYIGVVNFTPDNLNLFLPSDDTDGLRIGLGGETGGEEEGNLPNTGGPNAMWLVLGTGLLVAGAGGVGYGRRRQGALA